MRGSVQKRGNSWTVRVDLPPASGDGRRQHSKGGFPTRKEAQAYLNGVLAKIQAGSMTSSGRIRLADFVEIWLPGVKTEVEETTWRPYEAKLRLYVLPALGQVRIADLQVAHIKALYGHLSESGGARGQGLSPRTVRYVHATLHRMFRDAVSWGYLTRNPVDSLQAPTLPRREVKTWTDSQLTSFLHFAQTERLFPLWVLAADSGLRRSELLGIRWKDLDGSRLMVRGTLTKTGWRPRAKTASSLRPVALTESTVDVLKTWRSRQAEENLSHGVRGIELVFTWEDGRPLGLDWTSKRFTRLVKESGLPKIRLHDMRHTWATLALEAGIPLKVVADRLGHSSTWITENLYTRSDESMQREAAERVGGMWLKRSG